MARLDTLPLEILFHILSYTDPIHCFNLTTYPLNQLAATNRHLRATVEEYARGRLIRDAGIERSKTAWLTVCRRKWLRDMCYFCKKSSKRKACFYSILTCCIACDKKEFAKMTMTEAREQTHLSKLDLFTPSPLYPRLPPLPTGMASGNIATMLSTPDVLARKEYIRALLGDGANDEAFMRKRQARHDRIIKHLDIDYYEGAGWVERNEVKNELLKGVPKKVPKSMQTREGRMRYAEEGLQSEWRALGMELGEDVDVMAFVWESMNSDKWREGRVRGLSGKEPAIGNN